VLSFSFSFFIAFTKKHEEGEEEEEEMGVDDRRSGLQCVQSSVRPSGVWCGKKPCDVNVM